MAKRAAKAPAAAEGKVVEIVTRTTERRTGEDDELEIAGAVDEGSEDDILDDVAEGARLEIRRTSPAEFAGYVGTYSRDGWTPDRLFEEWGGGKFTIRVRNTDGTMQGQRHLQLAGKPKNKEAPTPITPALAPASGGGEMAQALAAIAASNAAARDSTKDQITLLTTLITSLISKEAPQPAPAPDPLAMLEKAASILRPRGGEEGGAMAAFIKGIDMGRSLSEGGGEPGMGTMFMEGIKTIRETAALTQQRPQRRIAAPGTVPAQPATPPLPNKQGEPMSDTMKAVAWIKQQAAFLVIQAEREKSPALYAELFVDNLPPFLPAAQVLTQMKAPDALNSLSMLNGDVLKFQEWFEEFRAAVVRFLEVPQQQAGQPPVSDAFEDSGEGVGE